MLVVHFINSHHVDWTVTGKPKETGQPHREAGSSGTGHWLWTPTRCGRKSVCVSPTTDGLLNPHAFLFLNGVCNRLHNCNMTVHFIWKIQVFWGATPCWIVNSYRRIWASYCFYLDGLLFPVAFASVHAHGRLTPLGRDVHTGVITCPVRGDRLVAIIYVFWSTRLVFFFSFN